jgi:hypothetical protein
MTVPSSQDHSAIYPVEEAQAILQIAIARHTEEGELTRQQLLEIAEELGISELTLAEAEQQWQLQRREQADMLAFDEFQKQRFQGHLIRFAVVNLVLFAVNWMAVGTVSWALYILLFWGGALGLQAWHSFYPNSQRYRQNFERWRRREQIKRSFNRLMDWLLGT